MTKRSEERGASCGDSEVLKHGSLVGREIRQRKNDAHAIPRCRHLADGNDGNEFRVTSRRIGSTNGHGRFKKTNVSAPLSIFHPDTRLLRDRPRKVAQRKTHLCLIEKYGDSNIDVQRFRDDIENLRAVFLGNQLGARRWSECRNLRRGVRYRRDDRQRFRKQSVRSKQTDNDDGTEDTPNNPLRACRNHLRTVSSYRRTESPRSAVMKRASIPCFISSAWAALSSSLVNASMK